MLNKPATIVAANTQSHQGSSGPLRSNASVEEIKLALNFLFAVEEGLNTIGRYGGIDVHYQIQPLNLALRVEEIDRGGRSKWLLTQTREPNESAKKHCALQVVKERNAEKLSDPFANEALTHYAQQEAKERNAEKLSGQLMNESLRMGIFVGKLLSSPGKVKDRNPADDSGALALFRSKADLVASINHVANNIGEIKMVNRYSGKQKECARTVLIRMLDNLQKQQTSETDRG